jgi:hypothetical protein
VERFFLLSLSSVKKNNYDLFCISILCVFFLLELDGYLTLFILYKKIITYKYNFRSLNAHFFQNLIL